MNEVELEGRRLLAAAREEADAAESEPVESEAADAAFERAAELRDERARLLDRLRVVVDEWEAKGADVTEFRNYISAVSGIEVDVTDTQSAAKTLLGWARSEEGGLRLLWQVGTVLGVTVVAWLIGGVVSWLLGRGLSATQTGSKLLRKFLGRWTRRVIAFIGFLVGLSAVGINVGPMVAAVGAAGFVIGLALQGTLSNFASGILIMTQRPFDVGDTVETAGITGTIDSVTLFSTHLTTTDNKQVIVPNNAIWGGNITNATVKNRRRLEIELDVADTLEIGAALERVKGVIDDLPFVLAEPKPAVELKAVDRGKSLLQLKVGVWVPADTPGNPRLEMIEHLHAAFPDDDLKRAA
jgi:small conductance mechanosensitive channel